MDPRMKELVTCYGKGVTLSKNFREEAYLSFFRIVEFFLEGYRKKFERKTSVEGSNVGVFKNEFYGMVQKHFPKFPDNKIDAMFRQIRGRLFYQEIDLINSFCVDSGYYETSFKRAEDSLREL